VSPRPEGELIPIATGLRQNVGDLRTPLSFQQKKSKK
jgi:hypothetical protein